MIDVREHITTTPLDGDIYFDVGGQHSFKLASLTNMSAGYINMVIMCQFKSRRRRNLPNELHNTIIRQLNADGASLWLRFG
jgi:hypothetical protein